MLKTSDLITAPDAREISESPSLSHHLNNFLALQTTEVVYLGDLVNNSFYHTWSFDGSLAAAARYRLCRHPLLSFYMELHCALSETECPPVHLRLSDINPVEHSYEALVALEKVQSEFYYHLGQSGVSEIHLDDLSISSTVLSMFLQMLEARSVDKAGTYGIRVLKLTRINFDTAVVTRLVQLVKNAKHLHSLDFEGCIFTDEEANELLKAIVHNTEIKTVHCPQLIDEHCLLLEGVLSARQLELDVEQASSFERFVMACEVGFIDTAKREVLAMDEAILLRDAQLKGEQAFKNMDHFINALQYQVTAFRTGLAAAQSGKVKAQADGSDFLDEVFKVGLGIVEKTVGINPLMLGSIPIPNPAKSSSLTASRITTLSALIKRRRKADQGQKEHDTAMTLEKLSRRDLVFIQSCVIRLGEIYEPIISRLCAHDDISVFTQAVGGKFLDAVYEVSKSPRILSHMPLIDFVLASVVNAPPKDKRGTHWKLRKKNASRDVLIQDYKTREPHSANLWSCVEVENLIFANESQAVRRLQLVKSAHSGMLHQSGVGYEQAPAIDDLIVLEPGECFHALKNSKMRVFRHAISGEIGSVEGLNVYFPDGYAYYADRMQALSTAKDKGKLRAKTIVADLKRELMASFVEGARAFTPQLTAHSATKEAIEPKLSPSCIEEMQAQLQRLESEVDRLKMGAP